MTDFKEDDICPTAYCSGTLRFNEVKECRCHISPPCNACVENKLSCSVCGEEIEND